MKKWSGFVASLLAAVMTVGVFASCKEPNAPAQTGAQSETETPSKSEETGETNEINGKPETKKPETDTDKPSKPENPTSEPEKPASDGLDFYPLPDGTYAVDAGKTKFLAEIVIPSTYNGKAVTKILDSAFTNCGNLTSVTIPDSVTSVGNSAFSNCNNLTSITIPGSVTSIGEFAFSGCNGLTSVYITNLERWCDITFDDPTANPLLYANNLYLNGTLVAELIIPDGVTSIGNNAFSNCNNLTNITIPDSMTSIGKYAFYGCSNLMSIIYHGTQAQWNVIQKGSDWTHNWSGFVICTDGTIDMNSDIFVPETAVLPKNNGNIASISGIDSSYAVLVDAETGEILAGKNADAQFSPASMTKVMTLIVACEKLKTGELNKVVYMTNAMREYVTTGNYKGLQIYGFEAGQGARIEDLLYGIGVVSAADCMMMVASYICPAATPAESEAAFVALMNAEAQAMGLTSTHFDNPFGDESDGNKSTATEIAAIMMRALKCNLIQKILSTNAVKFTTYVEGGQPISCYFISTLFRSGDNTNSRQYAYEQAYGTFKLSNLTLSGGKTGTLGDKKTGFIYSLVSFATGGGKTYIVVTGETRTGANVLKDAKTIYDGYAH